MKKLLIVDDETDIVEGLRTYVEFKGYKVFVATSADEAIPIVKKSAPEVILLDIHLKGDIDGITLLKQIKSLLQTARVIMISGTEDSPQEEILRLGAYAYLHKPINLEQLDKLI